MLFHTQMVQCQFHHLFLQNQIYYLLFHNNKLYKFAIVLKSINVVGSYETKVLNSINGDNENYLDAKIGNDSTYYFTGLALVPESKPINGAVYFSPCKSLTNKDGTKTAVID